MLTIFTKRRTSHLCSKTSVNFTSQKGSGKFDKLSIISEAMKSSKLISIDYKNSSNQFPDKDLVVGYVTKQKINKLLDDGETTESSYKSFFDGAREFFVRATEHLLASCPFQGDILCHATWIDFKNRLESFRTEFFIC